MKNEEKNLPNEENDLPVEEVLEENGEAKEKMPKKLSRGAIIGIIAGAAAVILAVVLILVLSGNKKCDHTFSDKWYNDAENHWHPATCEHAETERGDFGAHADTDENGVCDVCEYEMGHKHSFSSEWTVTDTHHWNAATCTHTDEKGNYSTHSDENIDGVCDECSGHVHKVNAAGYCTHSGCGDKVRDVDETSLDALVSAVVEQAYLVNGGNIDYTFTGRSNTSPDFEALRKEVVSYVFGKDNYTHINVDTDVTIGGNNQKGTLETWHHLLDGNNAFGVVSENGGELTLDITELGKLNGYYIALSTLAGDYGVEATLYALYEAAIADTTDELIVIPDAAENKVTFKYSYKTVFVNETEVAVGDENTPAGSKIYNVNYFDVEVTFKYSDDFALTYLMIDVDCFTNDPGTAERIGFLYDDVDIQYDPETDEITFVKYDHDAGKYLPIETQTDPETGEIIYVVYNEKTGEYVPAWEPTPDTYVIEVTQTVGERNEENPNHRDKFIPENFDLYHKMNEDGSLEKKFTGSNIMASVRESVFLYVGDCTPEGTSLHFTYEFVSIKAFKNGEELHNIDAYDNEAVYAVFTLRGEQRMFLFIPKMDGAYRFEIYLDGKKVYDVNMTVGVVDDENLDLDDDQFAIKVTDAYSWTTEVSFTATEAGTYYFNIPAGISFINADDYDKFLSELDNSGTQQEVQEPDPYFDYNKISDDEKDAEKFSFSVELRAGETIRFYVNAIKVGTYVVQVILF